MIVTAIINKLPQCACSQAHDWVATFTCSPRETWEQCPNGSWLLWLCDVIEVPRELIVLAACDCVEPALVYVPTGEDRPRLAVETARAWAKGEASFGDVHCAAETAAYASRAAAHATRAAYAAAAYAAYAADATRATAAADAVAAAAYAAYAADAARAAAAYASPAAAHAARATRRTARRRSLAHSADLVRARIPWSLVADYLTIAINRGVS